MRLRLICLLLLCCLLPTVKMAVAEPLTVQVVPFTAGPTTPAMAEALFDGFVDQLDQKGPQQGVLVEIIKVPITEVNADWLAQRTWIAGEASGYSQDVGCCSTQFEVRARIDVHTPGVEPLVVEEVEESFFNHDLTQLAVEQLVVSERLGRALADRWLEAYARR